MKQPAVIGGLPAAGLALAGISSSGLAAPFSPRLSGDLLGVSGGGVPDRLPDPARSSAARWLATSIDAFRQTVQRQWPPWPAN